MFMNRFTTRNKSALPSGFASPQTNQPPLSVHESSVVEQEPATFELCCYHNQTTTVLVIRSVSLGSSRWHLERVVFPGQRLMFYAPLHEQIQVYSASIAGNLSSDMILCDRLRVDET
jgi:hypothetical protein